MGNYYYVDELFKKLGIYKEGMTVQEVISLLKENIRYLANYIPIDDENHKDLYNIACKTIHMGEFKGFDITDMYNLSTLADNYAKGKDIGDYFIQISNWELNIKRKEVPVTINFTEGLSVDPIVFICSASKKDLANFLLKEIKRTDPNLLNGEGYASLQFKISDDLIQRQFGSGPTLRLTKALLLIQKSFPEFDFYCPGSARMYSTYMWAYNTYNNADIAFAKYITERRKHGISLLDAVENYTDDISYRRKAVKETLIEELGVKVGEIVLFSLVPFSQACPYINVPQAIVGINCDGEVVLDSSNMRRLDFDSFFLGKIVNYNDDFLVIRLKYELMNKTTNITIPVPWDLLLPNLTDGIENGLNTKAKLGFNKYRKKNNDSEFLQALNLVPILLTSKNCSSLRKPLFPIIYNKF